MLSEKATQLGAVQNRLESALESTTVAVENLVSSRSTLRDADIAKESSSYIKAQILQQASATLLATANQSPSIALQLI
jgi:flagellin